MSTEQDYYAQGPSKFELAARAAKARGEDELAAAVAVADPGDLAEAFRLLAEHRRGPSREN
jgi:hypothetical protein